MSDFDKLLNVIIIVLILVVIFNWLAPKLSCVNCDKIICKCDKMSVSIKGSKRSKRSKKSDSIKGYKRDPRYAGDSAYNNLSYTEEGPMASHVTSKGPIPKLDAERNLNDWSGSVTKGLALEDGVSESHARYCDSLAFAGMPTGASACTTLEETGRSYGTSDFIGLTSRKFCKARNLAVPGCDARQTPTQNITEWCDIGMDQLV